MKVKKIMSALIAAGMLAGYALFPSGAELFTADADTEEELTKAEPVEYYADSAEYIFGDFKYKLENGRAVITKYTGEALYVSVPDEVSGVAQTYPVTKIGEKAFWQCTKIIKVTLPDTVNFIDKWAFSGCKAMTSINFPDDVYWIGESAFSGCESMVRFDLPDKVRMIGDKAFGGCTSLKSFVVPKSMKGTGFRAFCNCTSLETVVFHDEMTAISDQAFEGCTSLKNVVFPSGATHILASAFKDCTSLESIFIPENLHNIYENAFRGCTNLKRVEIAPREERLWVYDNAFKDCTSLSELVGAKYAWFNNYRNSMSGIFENCTSLTDFEFFSTDISVTSYEFKGCTGLTSLTLPPCFGNIYNNAFENCTNLEKIVIPSAETRVNENAFKGCEKLTIYSVEGGKAHTYAKENGIKFVAIDPAPPTISGTVALIDGGDASDVSVSIGPSSYKTNRSGGSFESVDYLRDGKYTVSFFKSRGYRTPEYTVTVVDNKVVEPAEPLNVILYLFGDIDSSGEVNISDALQIVNYRNGKKSVFDTDNEDELNNLIAAADLNGDGQVNISDALQIVNYRNGKTTASDYFYYR